MYARSALSLLYVSVLFFLLNEIAQRMARAGAVLTTCESAIFELLGDAKHAKFKEILPLVKDFAQARSAATAPAATGGSKL